MDPDRLGARACSLFDSALAAYAEAGAPYVCRRQFVMRSAIIENNISRSDKVLGIYHCRDNNIVEVLITTWYMYNKSICILITWNVIVILFYFSFIRNPLFSFP